jgi:hypothetical protein
VPWQEQPLLASPLPAPPLHAVLVPVLAADPALLLPPQPPLPPASLPPRQHPKVQLALLLLLLLPSRTADPALCLPSGHSQQQRLMHHTKYLHNRR